MLWTQAVELVNLWIVMDRNATSLVLVLLRWTMDTLLLSDFASLVDPLLSRDAENARATMLRPPPVLMLSFFQ